MRHKNAIKSLGRKAQPRKALMKTLSHSLIMNGKIVTTLVKAKVLRPHIEKLVTIGKKETLAAHRQLLGALPKASATKLSKEIAKTYKERKGGYIRITKLGHRPGDNAEKVMIEFV